MTGRGFANYICDYAFWGGQSESLLVVSYPIPIPIVILNKKLLLFSPEGKGLNYLIYILHRRMEREGIIKLGRDDYIIA